MKLLLDANVSWRLTRRLHDFCEKIQHVDQTELQQPAKDEEIWGYAKRNGYIILTNDEDFLNLVLKRGFPPKIVLLRTGNQSTREVADLLEKHKNQISKLETTDHLGILEIF